jgi:hypothetical protein
VRLHRDSPHADSEANGKRQPRTGQSNR